MTETTEVVVRTEFYDAGESVYRRRDETFETDDPGAFGDLVEPADDSGGADPAAETGGSGGEDTAPPFAPGDYTVDELEARMDDSDHTDAERQALADAERDGENRRGAIEVLSP